MKSSWRILAILGLMLPLGHAMCADPGDRMPEVLDGTQRLTLEGDIASNLVAGVDRFLLKELD